MEWVDDLQMMTNHLRQKVMSSQLVPELVVMQLAAPVREQTHSVDELPIVANRSTSC